LLIKPRPRNDKIHSQALEAGLSALQAHIVAGRLVDFVGNLDRIINPALRYIDHPELLQDSDKAATRIARALREGQRIGIVTDYDVDGVTSHALIQRALTVYFNYPASNIDNFIGHRVNDGYGVSKKLTERILSQPELPAVIITADCGSSDEAQVIRLQQAGIDVIVTDHHALPITGPPSSAYAVINPLRADCRYPDTTVAGCMIAWLLMARVRSRLIEDGQLPADVPKLAKELDYVSLGTVADCVSIGTPINRAVVNVGLSQMNALNRPCWQAMQTLLNRNGQQFCAEDLAFQIGPRINARSRMADPYAALHFLLASDHENALHYLKQLDSDNQDRKFIERDMTETAKQRAASLVEQGFSSLVIYLPEGHPGVQGIVASRLVEAFGRPAIVLCDSHEPTQLTGSARGIAELHLRDALQGIVDVRPELLVKFGGHKHAAGLAIERTLLNDFQTAFEQAVCAQLGDQMLAPIIWTDGTLPAESFSLDTLAELDRLQPFGREFEAPIFEGHFEVAGVRAVGAEPIHLSLQLRAFDAVLSAIWFRALEAAGDPLPLAPGDTVHCAYQLNGNTFRGKTTLQLIVRHAIKTSS